jgi:class 3 adenylate cyclase
MNLNVLERKFAILRKEPELPAQAVSALALYLSNGRDGSLPNMNPYTIAGEIGVPAEELIPVFLHGSRIGLFNFHWNMLCRFCGGIVHNHDRLLDLKESSYHCVVCDVEYETDLDSLIEVAFTLSEDIKSSGSDPLKDYGSYRRFYFSENHIWPEEFEDYFHNESLQDFLPFLSEDVQRVTFRGEAGAQYRLSSPDQEAMLNIRITGGESPDPLIIDLELSAGGFSHDDLELDAGEITLKITSHIPSGCGIMITKVNAARAMSILGREEPRFKPYLSGKALLNNQTFRRLFKITRGDLDFRLKVSNLTLVFTDLKGSTAMYERNGDIDAYALVQTHFDELMESTAAHGGSIVKTIGDAVMASFSSPVDAVGAVRDMMERIRRLNETEPFLEETISIKVGMHCGTAIAVTANNILDYFGQTVNTAARVQGLSDGGEVWMTGAVLQDRNVRQVLLDRGIRCFRRKAYLKGISSPVPVYHCTGWQEASPS